MAKNIMFKTLCANYNSAKLEFAQCFKPGQKKMAF